MCKISVKVPFNIPDNFCSSELLITLYVMFILKFKYSDEEYQKFVELINENFSIPDNNMFSTMDVNEWYRFVINKANNTSAVNSN